MEAVMAKVTDAQIVDHLRYCRTKDREKHGHDGGFRSTLDIAEAFSVSTATARRRLHRLHQAGLIGAFDGGASGHMGNPIDWRIADGAQ
jgi:DNA-binding Lrp family transcriptional regulator